MYLKIKNKFPKLKIPVIPKMSAKTRERIIESTKFFCFVYLGALAGVTIANITSKTPKDYPFWVFMVIALLQVLALLALVVIVLGTIQVYKEIKSEIDNRKRGGKNDRSWIQTFSGGRFWPMNPRIEDINITDIAHALSMQCRYAGHTTRFYSVAEHSLYVSLYVPAKYALWGLLHDASEAYLMDVTKPVKPFLKRYKKAEKKIMALICQKYGLSLEEPPEVKAIDTRILGNEREALMNRCVAEWHSTGNPIFGLKVVGMSPETAEELFLKRFYALWSEQA